MGKYINKDSKGSMLPALGKAKCLIADGAKVIEEPKEFSENLVCVLHNGLFDAAGYAYCKSEMEAFKEPDDRSRTWLVYEHAKNLTD